MPAADGRAARTKPREGVRGRSGRHYGDGLHRERRVHHQDRQSAVDAPDRRDVTDKIEAKIVVKRHVKRVI
jgi:hypothetical protein